MNNKYLPEVIKGLEKIKSDSINTFGSLDGEQLNWKPSPGKWSIGQCFDHLMVSNKTYFPELTSVINGEEIKNFWKKVPLLSGFSGTFLLKSLVSRNRKFKAPDIFEPSSGTISTEIINDFSVHQDTLLDLIRQSDKFDHEEIIITSPVAKFITYSLTDTFSILSAHEQRHYEQAERVLKSEAFPK
ncbi:MAG: DinB family protein [Ignavibacteria bacterium]